MIGVIIRLDGDNAWRDLRVVDEVLHLGEDSPPMQIAVLEHGMASGRPSVAIRLDLPDGRTVIAQTSARLFCGAAKAIMAKFPDLFRDDA